MMTFDDLTELLAGHLGQGECVREAYQGITLKIVQPLTEPSASQASTPLSILQIRERTTREAGISTLGFEATLQNLAARPPNEQLLQWTLESPDKAYVIFVAEASDEVVGCIRVAKRLLTPLQELTRLLSKLHPHPVERAREPGWKCLFQLHQLLVLQMVRAVGDSPGIVSSSDALERCRLEYEQQQPGRHITGDTGALLACLERTMQNLVVRQPGEALIQWVLEAPSGHLAEDRNDLFTLFISEASHEVIGCFTVERQP